MKQIKLVSFIVFLILLVGSTGRVYPMNSDIFQAIKKHDLSTVKTILEKDITNLEKLDENKYSPLHLACEIGDLKIVHYLVQKGAKINIKNHQENTPLHLASSKSHFPVVKFLVSSGADVNKKNFRGRIPALRAIVYKNLGESINTPGHELSPVVTPDGKFLFFIRGTDIYWVDAKIIEKFKPKELK